MRIQLASTTLVLISIGALMAETVPGVALEYASLWHGLEWVFMIGFGLEYLAYLYVAANASNTQRLSGDWLTCLQSFRRSFLSSVSASRAVSSAR